MLMLGDICIKKKQENKSDVAKRDDKEVSVSVRNYAV